MILATIGGIIANIGASKVTTDIIKNLVNLENQSKIGKIFTAIGMIGISGLVGDAVQTYSENQIEKGIVVIQKLGKIGQTDDEEESEIEEEDDAE